MSSASEAGGNDVNILEEIASVIDIEIEGLQAVRQHLTPEFQKAVEVIAGCTGQVFVTGVGKSGIIASKIAATLCSTGTRAIFLHAAEALHGDIGAVRAEDVVLALGKTGESTELNELLRALRKNGNVIISLTANPGSAMAKLSDVIVDLGNSREACPLNLAPTTSTTAALVIGDAIAVTLMKLKNISAEDFARSHPGGQLGRRLLLKVEDVMRTGGQNPVITKDRTIKEMLVTMTGCNAGAVSVITENGELLGLVTDYDVRKVLETEQDIFSLQIENIMNRKPSVAYVDDKAADALAAMNRRAKPITILPVLNRGNRVVGLVHVQDLISAGL
jgi:arabinose-5-phosphate isomerase